MIRFTLGMMVGILLLEVMLILEGPRPATAPIPAIHTYNVEFSDGTQTAVLGNRITTAGACIEVWLGGRVDTIFCGVHYITEKLEGPAADPLSNPMPAPNLPELNPSREVRG